MKHFTLHAATNHGPVYSESNNADGSGWSNTLTTKVKSVGAIHGPWGNDAKQVSKTITIPAFASECIVNWRSWQMDSRDHEADRLRIDGKVVWQKAATYGCTAGHWKHGPSDVPNPWGGKSDVCYVDVSVDVPCAKHMLVEFESDINQPKNDESWAFSNFEVYPKRTLAVIYQENGAKTTGWSNAEVRPVSRKLHLSASLCLVGTWTW